MAVRLPPARRNVRIGAVVAAALAAGFVTWFVLGGRDESDDVDGAEPAAVSSEELARLATSIQHPVYWAGPIPGFTYELTQTGDGRIFIRYLPPDVDVGATEGTYLTVATYPLENAIAAVRAIAQRTGAEIVPIGDGGIIVQDRAHPTSVYLAYRGSPYQVEIFDPSPANALRLASSGAVVRVESHPPPSRATRPRLTTVAGLRSVASSLGHPIYWAGPIPARSLELTTTSDGRVYIRYLRRGVSAGTRNTSLTVGTYPLRDAFAAVQAIARRPGAEQLPIPNGVAVVEPARPTSVYLAFRGSNYQVEVFDPSAASARALVASNRVAPVR